MATDRTKQSRLRVESLEDRTMPVAGLYANSAGGILRVTDWRPTGDTLIVRQNDTSVTIDAGGDAQTFTNVNRVFIDTKVDGKLFVDNASLQDSGPRSVFLSLRDDSGKIVRQGELAPQTAAPQTPDAAPSAQPTAPQADAPAPKPQGFADASIEEINQGRAGTCVFLASLAAVVASGNDLASNVKAEGNNMYSVPMYRPGTGWVTQHVYFDGTAGPNDPVMRDASNAWVVIYQRAYLQEKGVDWTDPNAATWGDKYGNSFRQVDQALLAITGNAVWHGKDGSLDGNDLNAIRTGLKGGQSIIALSETSGGLPNVNFADLGLIQGHAYTVMGVGTDSKGEYWVKLRNPWGTDGPKVQGADDGYFWMQWNGFRNLMQGYVVSNTNA